ncbi:jasmonate-induced oxygenase 4-like [Silene latifolia]|uniref:jasmonate-induced oxygenase 4-like n=1 Tax=Silene latifolia TaxID=37657 RepID=UPI003D78347B
MPLEEKIKYSSSDEKVQGYAANLGRSRSQTNYWSDRLFLNLQPEENRKLKFWPQKPANFSKIIDEYSKKLTRFSEAIYKAMARSLKLEEDCFIKNQGRKMAMSGGFNFYPSCPSPERVLGVKAHSDGSTMTILLPDAQVAGLQVLKNDIWYNVPIIPGALLINLGDLGEVMTNGIFKSVIHRVVTNSEKDRLSVAAFFTSEDKKEIGPVTELINEQHPQLYRKLDTDEFRTIFFEALSQGRKTLDALKL